MLSSVKIRNFKSIRELEFAPRRVNIFIGEPSSGKSNMLEALAFFSAGVYEPKTFKEVFRFRKTPDLFFDREISKSIQVQAGSLSFELAFTPPKSFEAQVCQQRKVLRRVELSGSGLNPYQRLDDPTFGVCYYRFRSLSRFSDQMLGILYPPYGSNLAAVLASNHDLRRKVSDLFKSKGFRLQLDPLESELALAKDVDDQLFKYPYESGSETLRRVVFFLAAMETNRNAVLLFNEPEANTFPFYTKFLAERMALDKSNQYFISTHNPYVLSSLVEKTPVKELRVFITFMENFQTRLKRQHRKACPAS